MNKKRLSHTCIRLLLALCVMPHGAKASEAVSPSRCGDETTSFYFGYGANVDAPFMRERLKEGEWIDDWHRAGANSNKSPIDLGCYILENYFFSYNLDGAPFGEEFSSASVGLKQESKVFGVLWSISGNDLKKLDIDEDLPRAYLRKCLSVRSCNMPTKETFAWVYVGQKDVLTASESPDPEYVNLIEKGAVAHNFPKEYIENVICKPRKLNFKSALDYKNK